MRCARPFLGCLTSVLCAVILASPVAAQTSLATGGAPEIPWLRLILSFALCVGLAVGAIVLLRRFQGVKAPRLFDRLGAGDRFPTAQVKIVETRRISPSAHVCLVEFDDRQFLLAVSGAGVSVVAERDLQVGIAGGGE